MPRESAPKNNVERKSKIINEVVDLAEWKRQREEAARAVEALVSKYEGDLEGLSGALHEKLQEIADGNDNVYRFLAEALAGELWLVEKQIQLSASHSNQIAA